MITRVICVRSLRQAESTQSTILLIVNYPPLISSFVCVMGWVCDLMENRVTSEWICVYADDVQAKRLLSSESISACSVDARSMLAVGCYRLVGLVVISLIKHKKQVFIVSVWACVFVSTRLVQIELKWVASCSSSREYSRNHVQPNPL